MTDKELLDAVEARAQSNLFSNALKQMDLAHLVGRGFLSTRKKIETGFSSSEAEKIRTAVQKAIADSHQYSNKAVYFWKIPNEIDVGRLIAAIPEWVETGEGNPYYGSYPKPLSEAELSKPNNYGVPTAFFSNEKSATLLFCSKREAYVEDHFNQEQMPDDWRALGYEEVIGRRKEVYQTFDCFSVYPEERIIELRVDFGHKLAEKEILKWRTSLSMRFNELALPIFNTNVVTGEPLNLFGAMTVLYAGGDWIVYQIGHDNEDGYTNANKGHYRNDDVRKSKYHKGGEVNVNALQLWSISVSFGPEGGTLRPRLLLEGHSSLLAAQVPVMHLARILDCSSDSDYHAVRTALLTSWSTANTTNDALSAAAIPTTPLPTTL